jgi:hypothetical protein
MQPQTAARMPAALELLSSPSLTIAHPWHCHVPLTGCGGRIGMVGESPRVRETEGRVGPRGLGFSHQWSML